MFFFFNQKQKMTHLYKFLNTSASASTEQIQKKINQKEKQINQKEKQIKSEQSKIQLQQSKKLLEKSKNVLLDYHKRRDYDFFQGSFFPRPSLFLPSFDSPWEDLFDDLDKLNDRQKKNFSSIVTKTSYEKIGENPGTLTVERTENKNGKEKTQKKSYIIKNGNKQQVDVSKIKS